MDLKDKSGTAVVSQIKIKLSLISESEDNFKSLMDNVDAHVSRLGGASSTASASISALGAALQFTKTILGIAGTVCYHYSFLFVVVVTC